MDLKDLFKHHEYWRNIVKNFGCNKDTAEDIVMEMYIIMDKKFKSKKFDSSVESHVKMYAYQVLRTLFIDLKRKEKNIVFKDIEDCHDIFDNESVDFVGKYEEIQDMLSKEYWYNRQVYEIVQSGVSILSLSESTGITYKSLRNTYNNMKAKVKKILK